MAGCVYSQKVQICYTHGRPCVQPNAVNLHMAGRQMATLDVAKLLLLTNQTKLTLSVTLTLTDTVTVIFFTRILLTHIARLNRNNKINFCGGAVAGIVGGPVFPFSDFLPVC